MKLVTINLGDMVHIVDPKSIGNGKSGVVIMSLGSNEYLVKVLINGEARNIAVNGARLKRIEEFANGGSVENDGKNITVKILNEGDRFGKSKYEAVFGDYDHDGIANIDDPHPRKKGDKKMVEDRSLESAMGQLIDIKNDLDNTMHHAVKDIVKAAPSGANVYARTKTPYSIMSKLISKRLIVPNNIKRGLTDLIGTTIAVDTFNDLQSMRKVIEGNQLYEVNEVEDFYEKPLNGYRAVHYILVYKDKNGTFPIELQLKTKRMKAINELSHPAYAAHDLNAQKLEEITSIANQADMGNKSAIEKYNGLMKDKESLKQSFYMNKKMKHGGSLESENAEMVMNDARQIMHHAGELMKVLEKASHVPAWVVAKIHAASEDLSASTHFLGGEAGMTEYGKGGGVGKTDKLKWAEMNPSEILSKIGLKDLVETGFQAKRSSVYDRESIKLSEDAYEMKKIVAELEKNGIPDKITYHDISTPQQEIWNMARTEREYMYIKGQGFTLHWKNSTYTNKKPSVEGYATGGGVGKEKPFYNKFASELGKLMGESIELDSVSVEEESRQIEFTLGSGANLYISHDWSNDGTQNKPVTSIHIYPDIDINLGRFGIPDDAKEYAEDIYAQIKSEKFAKGGGVGKTITVEVYGGKKINYTNSEIQEMIDEIDMYMSSDNLPKWIIQSRKNGNINFPKDKKGVLEFLNKIKDSKSDVYINVDSNIPTYKHYVKMAKGGEVGKTITVEVYGGKKINYTNSEIQEMIDEIDMYMSSDNLPKWIIQSRKNGNINFPKDKKGVLEFLNKIKDSKSDVYINVDSNIPTYKHYVKMAKGGEVGSFLNKAKELGKAGFEKSKVLGKAGVEKAKEFAHEQKRKMALDVIRETKGNVGGTEASYLKKAGQIVKSKFAKGGGVKDDYELEKVKKISKFLSKDSRMINAIKMAKFDGNVNGVLSLFKYKVLDADVAKDDFRTLVLVEAYRSLFILTEGSKTYPKKGIETTISIANKKDLTDEQIKHLREKFKFKSLLNNKMQTGGALSEAGMSKAKKGWTHKRK